MPERITRPAYLMKWTRSFIGRVRIARLRAMDEVREVGPVVHRRW